MPDPSHRPYEPMTIIRPHTMPPFWWLVPWAYARTLHMSANALKAYADQADRTIEMQIRVIEDKNHDIELLRRRIADLEDAVIRGKAIVPDATPHRDETIHE